MSAARSLVAIMVPLYLAARGYSGILLGEVFVASAVVSLVVSTSVGLAADRVGRKPFLVAIPLLMPLSAALLSILTHDWTIFAGAALSGVGRGAGSGGGSVGAYQPAESAFVADITPNRWRNDAFSRLSFLSSLGAIAGSLIAVVLSPGHVQPDLAARSYRAAFIAIGSLGMLAGLVALWLEEPVRATHFGQGGYSSGDLAGQAAEQSSPNPQAQSQLSPGMHSQLRSPGSGGGGGRGKGEGSYALISADEKGPVLPRRSLPLLIRLWVTNSVNGIAAGMLGPFFTYWLYRRYGAGPGAVGALYALTNLATLGSAVVAAPLARRFRTVKTVVALRVLQALALIPIALSPYLWLAGALYLLRMFAQRTGMPLRQSYVLALADPRERASVAALSNVPGQAAMTASPLLAGYLFEQAYLTVPLELAGLLQLVNAILYYLFFYRMIPPEEQNPPASPPNQSQL